MEFGLKQVLPKVIWEECVATPHFGECTLPLRVLAVQYATLQNRCGALWNVTECYGSVTEPLRSIMDHYGNITEPLQNVMGCYGCVMELLQNVTEALGDITERYGAVAEALWSIAGV